MTATVIDALPDVDYFSHEALSSSGAKKLLPPSCPALFQWERQHGRTEKRTFDFGHAAHAKVLGIGAPLAVLDFPNYQTKAAQQAKKDAYEAGHVPLLAAELEVVDAMAEKIREHPIASVLFDPDHGKPEQSFFWHDARHGIDRRARVDWLPDPGPGRLIVPDYKTTTDAGPWGLGRTAGKFRYHMQAPWYLDAVEAAGLADDAAFLFVFQEKTAPYLVTVVQLDPPSMLAGRAKNARAMDIFADCTASNTWPGYSDDVELISLPPWEHDCLESA